MMQLGFFYSDKWWIFFGRASCSLKNTRRVTRKRFVWSLRKLQNTKTSSPTSIKEFERQVEQPVHCRFQVHIFFHDPHAPPCFKCAMKGRTHCLNDFVFVLPQIPNLFGFWLAVSGVEQHIQIDSSILSAGEKSLPKCKLAKIKWKFFY